jgi:hypothetical protein
MNIQIKTIRMTDGSKAYDVIVSDDLNKLQFACTSERMANKFYIEFLNLVQECTVTELKDL